MTETDDAIYQHPPAYLIGLEGVSLLYPFSLRDTLLRLAEMDLYACLWSQRILEEMSANLVDNGRMTEEKAANLAKVMNAAFDDASVDAGAIADLEPTMTNHPKDRHVLAAAVVGEAHAVVTNNLKDFPDEALAPHGITASTADDFRQMLFAVDADGVVALRQQAADLNPPWELNQLLAALERAGAGSFVHAVQATMSKPAE